MRPRILPLAIACAAAAAGAGIGAQPPGGPATAPDPAPVAACADCHRQGAAWTKRKTVHRPVRDQACLACHGSHASKEPMLVRRSGARACLACHAGLLAATGSARPHAALTQEKACLACHDPHATDRAKLLKDEPAALCAACHATLLIPAPARPHAPAARGDCLACHDPHGTPGPWLLKKNEPALCTTCHRTTDPKTAAAHKGYPVAGSRCTSCHAPHGAPRPGLLRANLHLPFGEGECAACHQAGKAAIPAQARADLCTTCHEARTGGHPIPQLAGCTGCHTPHASSGTALAAGPDRVVCLACHKETAEQRAGSVSVHPGTGGVQDCTACHELHTGQTAVLLKNKDARATCAACHGDHSQFSHAMGEGVNDPSRPGRFLECLSCHDPHGTSYPGLLLADPRQDLCRRCHADAGL